MTPLRPSLRTAPCSRATRTRRTSADRPCAPSQASALQGRVECHNGSRPQAGVSRVRPGSPRLTLRKFPSAAVMWLQSRGARSKRRVPKAAAFRCGLPLGAGLGGDPGGCLVRSGRAGARWCLNFVHQPLPRNDDLLLAGSRTRCGCSGAGRPAEGLAPMTVATVDQASAVREPDHSSTDESDPRHSDARCAIPPATARPTSAADSACPSARRASNCCRPR